MDELDYEKLAKEIMKQLRSLKEIVLATSADGRVTARLMAPLSDRLTLLMSTGGNSQKVAQMRQNPNIALAIGNLKIEAVAELYGHPGEHPTFLGSYAKKFPLYAKLYKSSPEDMLVIAHPTKIALYKFLGRPCEEILLPEEKKALRMSI